MAFTANQALTIISGELAPPNNLFIDLVAQVALEKSIEFYNNAKTVDPVLPDAPTVEETNAQRYLNKHYRFANDIINNNSATWIKTMKVVVTQLSASNSYNPFVVATSEGNDNLWENKTTEVMARSLEILAEIKETEKTAYDAI